MATVTDSDLGDEFWTTTEAVRNEFELEVGNQQPDFEGRIRSATDSIQAKWADATGLDVPDDLPDTIPDLLQQATAYQAASEAHLAFAQNVSGENTGDQRHVFLEQKADDKFEEWTMIANLEPEGESSGEASEDVTGHVGVIGGNDRSPIQRGDHYFRRS